MIDESIVHGEGTESVYVYWFEAYRKQYSVNNYYWPCKIGMTKHGVYSRIFDQVKTGWPENPTIGLIIRTNDAADLEAMLHSFFKLKQRQKLDSGGTEWYHTTPDEVLQVCKLLRIVIE